MIVSAVVFAVGGGNVPLTSGQYGVRIFGLYPFDSITTDRYAWFLIAAWSVLCSVALFRIRKRKTFKTLKLNYLIHGVIFGILAHALSAFWIISPDDEGNIFQLVFSPIFFFFFWGMPAIFLPTFGALMFLAIVKFKPTFSPPYMREVVFCLLLSLDYFYPVDAMWGDN